MNGAPAKPISGMLRRQVGPRLPHRFHHEIQLVGIFELDHAVDVGRLADRIVNLRPLVVRRIRGPCPIGSRIGKQIGEDDRRIDAEPLDRRAHHFAAALRIAAELEEAHLLADRAVLRHVAAGLAHEPDGRVVDRLAAARAEEHAVVPGSICRELWMCGLRTAD